MRELWVAKAETARPLPDIGARNIARVGVLIGVMLVSYWLAEAQGAGAALRPAPESAPAAHAARTVSLNESARLQLTSKKGFTLNERGSTSGTIAGSMYIHLNLASTSKVTAEVNIYPREGSLTGTGSASYRVQGGVAVFSGTMSITRGTGKYAKARASGLRFTGTIQRRNDAVAVQLSGRLSY
jgi:hypothetical protein